MKKIFVIAIIATGLVSCEKIDGKQGDTIKFSATELKFDYKGGNAVITSEGRQWIIHGFAELPLTGTVKCSYDDSLSYSILKLESSWFEINKENVQKLVFTVQPNNTGETRLLGLRISDFDYFTTITLTQSAD
ncbi:MAG: hypothetical protein LBG92_01235 [Prevotellaceae bacterium]|jgi:hypothetical protein|nr:hypothetical protein [Prevotellaceae bacterium]